MYMQAETKDERLEWDERDRLDNNRRVEHEG